MRDTAGVDIAYLILTHGMPDHLGRLIGALRDDGVRFVVHVDRKTAIEPFLAHRAADVDVLDERVPIYWGEWQMVDATLRLMRRALETGHPDRLVLLSGSCYPIRSNRHIRSVLGAGAGTDEFINCLPMPDERMYKPISRLTRYRFRSDRSWVGNVARAVPTMMRGPHPGRPFSRKWLLTRDWRRELGLQPYAGSSWWALTGAAAWSVLDSVDRQPGVARFFENTRSPDESFFQTVLANSPFAERIRRGVTYADFREHGSHPALLTPDHVALFAEPGPFAAGGAYGTGEFVFARKVPDDGGVIARLLDGVIAAHDGALGQEAQANA